MNSYQNRRQKNMKMNITAAGMKDRHDSANSSAFPEIDNFILSLVNDLETGRTGYIRKVNLDKPGSFNEFHRSEYVQ